MSDRESGGGFLAGFVLGALAGAAFGVLIAPKSGRENREALAERMPELRTRAPEIINRASSEVMSRIQEGRDAFREGAEEIRERMTQELGEKRGESAPEEEQGGGPSQRTPRRSQPPTD